ncbi:MAG: DUF3829 domain-containing protein [Hyphomicrobiaceae bacterium]
MRKLFRSILFGRRGGRSARSVLPGLLLTLLALPPAVASDLDVAIGKANIYIEVAKATERAAESWERYLSWVNVKTGPTGQERYISYGLYDVYDVAELLEQAKQASALAPATPEIDLTMARYLAAYEALAPILNRASAYYDQQAYAADGMAEGKALHEKLVPLSQAFMAERVTLLAALTPFVREIEAQQLAAIEAAEGRSERWQVANVMHWADRVMDVFPKPRPTPMSAEAMDEMMQSLGPDTSGEVFDQLIAGVEKPKGLTIDMARLDAEMKGYAAAVDLFDAFAKDKSGEIDDFKVIPRPWLDLLIGLQTQLKPSNGQDTAGTEQWIGQLANGYFSMLSESSAIVRSQIRTLPWS